MNRFIQNLFLWLLPFFPLWVWAISKFTTMPYTMVLNLSLIPVAVAFLFNKSVKLPRYLACLIIFTLYHLYSVYDNDLLTRGTTWFKYILSDDFVFACVAFFVVENTDVEEWLIPKMNRHIFVAIIITFIVSIIQIKYVSFFISPWISADEDMNVFLDERRNYSIYSWVDLNSLGITFPILVSILINFYKEKLIVFFIVMSAIAVSFLTRTRYVMVSAIIVLSQLFFSSKFSLKKAVSFLAVIVVIIGVFAVAAHSMNFDVQKIIDERILEKGKDMSESSAGARLTSYNVFMAKFPEHPWFGVGPHTRDDVLDLLGGGIPIIHVGYLSYLYFYGVIGCFFFFLALFFLLRDAWLAGIRYKFWGSFYGLLAFCLANWTFVYFNLDESGIILAVLYLRFYKTNRERFEVVE